MQKYKLYTVRNYHPREFNFLEWYVFNDKMVFTYKKGTVHVLCTFSAQLTSWFTTGTDHRWPGVSWTQTRPGTEGQQTCACRNVSKLDCPLVSR